MSISLLPEFDADGYQVEPSTEKINEIITAVNESGGGGGGDTYPMHQAVWYDNSTAMAGTDTGSGMGLDPDMVYGALIRVTDPNAGLAGIGVRVMAGPANPATLRFGLYAVSDAATSRGLPGERGADLGTIAVDAEETGWLTLETFAAAEPGWYWVGVATTESLELMAWSPAVTGGALLGVRDPDGGNFQVAGGVELAAAGAQTAMPATLADVATASDRVSEAPYLAFRIGPL
jgi:hypothetical protein